MKNAPLPENESERIAALRRYAILDTAAEIEFDDFTWLASQICETPIALISLIDADRQWFKSKVGLALNETPREHAFCSHAICGNQLMEVPNILTDERFQNSPLVTGEMEARFYAGMPLTTADGFNLGALCVVDRVPRQLTATQQGALIRLGRQVMAQFELRRLHLERQRNEQRQVLRREVFSILMKSASYNQALPRLLKTIGAVLDCQFSAVWKLDDSEKFLRCVESCHPLDAQSVEFATTTQQKTLATGEGLPGRVWAITQPAWIIDLATDEDVSRMKLAMAAGMKSAFAFPILRGIKCLGVIEFFRKNTAKPDPELLQELAALGRQIGEFSERQRVQQQLEHEQFLLRTLMDTLPDKIYFKDKHSRFLRNSRAHLKHFGVEDQRLVLGKTDFDFFSEEHALQAFEDEQSLLRGEKPISKEEKEVWPDGRVTWVLSSKFALRNETGEIVGTYGVSRDITEYKLIQENLELMKKGLAQQVGLLNQVTKKACSTASL